MNKTTDTAGKVVLVTSYPFPDSAATANRVSTLANEIAIEGNLDVVVVGEEVVAMLGEQREGVVRVEVLKLQQAPG